MKEVQSVIHIINSYFIETVARDKTLLPFINVIKIRELCIKIHGKEAVDII